jgi:hypothetical protein
MVASEEPWTNAEYVINTAKVGTRKIETVVYREVVQLDQILMCCFFFADCLRYFTAAGIGIYSIFGLRRRYFRESQTQ